MKTMPYFDIKPGCIPFNNMCEMQSLTLSCSPYYKLVVYKPDTIVTPFVSFYYSNNSNFHDFQCCDKLFPSIEEFLAFYDTFYLFTAYPRDLQETLSFVRQNGFDG